MPPDDPDSNQLLGRQALLERVGAANAVYPMSCEEGPDAYQLRLGEIGKLDVIHLGMGPDGHTASLFPDSPALDADPGQLVALNEDPSGRNPHPRMTLTFSGIARSRLVLFTVAGEGKREPSCRPSSTAPTSRPARVTRRPGDLAGRPRRRAPVAERRRAATMSDRHAPGQPHRSTDAPADSTELLDAVGVTANRDQLLEILATVVRLASDGTDRLDLKIANAALKEMREGFEVFAPYRHVRKITMFGSARTLPSRPAVRPGPGPGRSAGRATTGRR